MNRDRAIDWEGRYRDGATGWERPGLHPSFMAWIEDNALSPCRILVPGGGRSLEPLALAEAGFDVTVVDLAESAVAAQRAKLARLQVKARVELADLFTWEAATPFDVVYDQACLCALPPDLWPNYATRVHRWLRPGGRLFILFMQTGSVGGPDFDCPIPAMRSLFAPPLWRWPTVLPPPVSHPSGRTEQPAILTATSPEAGSA